MLARPRGRRRRRLLSRRMFLHTPETPGGKHLDLRGVFRQGEAYDRRSISDQTLLPANLSLLSLVPVALAGTDPQQRTGPNPNPNPNRAALPIHRVRTIKRRPFFPFQASHSFIIYPVIHFFISPNRFSSSLPITYDSLIRFYLPTGFFTFSFSLSFLILILLSTIIY